MRHWLGRLRLQLLVAAPVAGVLACATGPIQTTFDPGAAAELADGMGILVVHVYSDIPLTSLEASRGLKLGGIPSGESHHLVVVPEGGYSWNRVVRTISGSDLYYVLDRTDEFRFDVKAGRTNYPGIVLLDSKPIRGFDGMYMSVRAVNRVAETMIELEARYPALLARYPMRYAGARPDPFMQRYHDARMQRTDSSAQEMLAP